MFLDGGLFANNPIMVAVADALSCYDVPRHSVRVLSIGSGGKRPTLGGLQELLGGSLFWATKVADTMIEFGSQNAMGQAMLLIGANNITRLTPDKSLWTIAMDDYISVLNKLKPDADRAFEAARETLMEFVDGEASSPMFYYGQKVLAADRRP